MLLAALIRTDNSNCVHQPPIAAQHGSIKKEPEGDEEV